MDITVIVMVGIKVKWTDLFENKSVSGCDHKHTSKFCPECGNPAKEIRNVPIFAEDAEYDSDMNAFHDLQLFRPYEHDEAFLGTILGRVSGDNYEEHDGDPYIGDDMTDLVHDAINGTKFENFPIRLWTILSTSP